MGIEANAAKWTSNWASLLVSMASNFSYIVLVAGAGDTGTFVPSLTRATRTFEQEMA